MDIILTSRNIIHAVVRGEACDFDGYISFLYRPSVARDREVFWKEIKELMSDDGKAWICIGDFNAFLG